MNSQRTYSLEVAVQPPSVARAGVPLYPPLVVRVHIYDASGNEITGEDELSGLFAQAALYRESGDPPPLAPPDIYILSGRLSMSLDLLNEPGTASFHGSPLSQLQGSYVLFPDLTINRPGGYRLGVSLFRVEGGRRMLSSSTGTMNGTGGGTTLLEAKTNVVHIQEGAVPNQSEVASQEFLNHLRSRGADVPSSPSR
ncbi:hypothetical protein K440DRAFT_606965 [Wilcoxina mikolae CBS 423.85]|nr:hypothetical protein K440DRAFT_606965 [Wilcoxina mikolae CBS 423.85]